MNIGYKGNRNNKKFQLIIASVVAAVVLLCVLLSVVFDVLGVGSNREKMVTVPKGAGLSAIAEVLEEEGIISYPSLFKLKVKSSGGEYVFQMGSHMLSNSMSYGEIIQKLTGPPDVAFDESVKVLIPEGYEIRQIAEVLEEKGLADSEEFIRETEQGEFDYAFIDGIDRSENRLEGYLFPATYDIIPGESEHEIIDRMLKAFEIAVIPIYEQSGTEMSLDEVITMASLIEREAANDSERGLVSSVFYNRIKADMTLSSCASVQYIIKERKPILSNSDIKIKSPYNTYINKGLPIGPIASPGEKSVRAALNPDETDYMYFVALMDGSKNVFSKTGEEHLRIVNKIQNGN